MKIYKVLNKKIKRLLRGRWFKIFDNSYDVFQEATKNIDEFYDKNEVTDKIRFRRKLKLIHRNESYGIINIAIYIAIIYGIIVSSIFAFKDYALKLYADFKVDANEVYKKAQEMLPDDALKEYKILYDQISSDVALKLIIWAIVMVALFLVMAFVLQKILSAKYEMKLLEIKINEYELERIEHKTNEGKAILRLENSEYLLEYHLINAIKK